LYTADIATQHALRERPEPEAAGRVLAVAEWLEQYRTTTRTGWGGSRWPLHAHAPPWWSAPTARGRCLRWWMLRPTSEPTPIPNLSTTPAPRRQVCPCPRSTARSPATSGG